MTRPNILILMVDQLAGTLFPDGPAAFLHAPNLARLAERSTRFANAYTASPLCAPGRAGFMSGLLPSRTRVYDNAAEFASDLPTFAHHLRRAGYATCLSGKMHFVGPDQLHGFEERLTTDIYPADFGWTPDWQQPDARIDWWYHNLGSVIGAGVAEITNQLDYDDEVAFQAPAKLYDLARRADPRPWCLTVSFTHPHDPYVARPRHWDLYADCAGPRPGRRRRSPSTTRTRTRGACWRPPTTPPSTSAPSTSAAPAAATSPAISYVDEKIGELLALLDRLGLADGTAVVFLSDHGDMLGERGLWFKMSFLEGSARVPLMLAAPGLAPGRVDRPVSTLDLLPTLAALAGIDRDALAPSTDGERLDAAGRGPVPMEYAAEGSREPMVALRDGAAEARPWPSATRRCSSTSRPTRTSARNLAADPAHAADLARLTAARPRPLGPRPLRRRGARQPGPPPHRLRGAPQRRPLPLGPPAAARAPPSATCATT